MRVALDALDGHSLNVERSGNGPNWIIAIHGFTGNASIWDSFVEAASVSYGVIRPELQGHGKSDAPDDPYLYDMTHTLAALSELTERMGINRAHWLGYSLGGRVALAVAVSSSEKVLSLTVESASGGIDDPKERSSRKEIDDALANKIEKGSIEDFVGYWESLPVFGTQVRLSREDKEQLKAERLKNNIKGLSNSLRGIGVGTQTPLYDKLSALQFPCLFVTGEEDVPYSDIARRMHNSVSRSQLSIAIQSGHAVHLEQPEIFNKTVLRFITMTDHLRGISQVQPGSPPTP